MKTGTFCVAAASHYGRGRVLAWADSTVFSNFEIFYPGKYEFLLNGTDWLNHKDWLGAATALAATGFAAAWATSWWEARQADFPEPKRPADWVFFAARSDDPGHHLRDFLTKEPYDQRYEVFIQWVLRTGAYSGFHLLSPDHRTGLREHMRDADNQQTAAALILRKPADLRQLDDFSARVASNGESILLMFASTIPADQAAKALQSAGLVRDADSLTKIAAAWPAGEVLLDTGGRRLLVVAGAERFSDMNMGITEKVKPDAKQRARFDQAFALIDRLFGKDPNKK